LFHDLTKGQKRALRDAVALAFERDRSMPREDLEAHYLDVRTGDLPLVVGGAVADGVLQLDDIAEPAREIVADLAGRISAVRQEIEKRPPSSPIEIVYDAAAVVSVSRIVDEIQRLGAENELYVNRVSGKVVVLEDEFKRGLEFDDSDEDEDDEEVDEEETDEEDNVVAFRRTLTTPSWITEAIEEAREIVSSRDWVPLLRREDLDEKRIMKRFAQRASPAASRDLFDAMSQRGAFRRFREVIRRRNLHAEWDAFRTGELATVVRFTLGEAGIPFKP
jgi:hypothetical protein